jgi:hypothetical protein
MTSGVRPTHFERPPGAHMEFSWGSGMAGRTLCDQVIRENPASRGTETSAEVLVGPPLGAGGWSETPVYSCGTRLTLALE